MTHTSIGYNVKRLFGKWEKMTVKEFEEEVKRRAKTKDFVVDNVRDIEITDENADKIFITAPGYDKKRIKEIETLVEIYKKCGDERKSDHLLDILSDYETEGEVIEVRVNKENRSVSVVQHHNYDIVAEGNSEAMSVFDGVTFGTIDK